MSNFHQSVLDRVLDGIDAVPCSKRADIYDGLAELFAEREPAVSKQAAEMARMIREAMSAQLIFKKLVSEAQSRQPENGHSGMTA